jgi:hypothetical protein
VIGGIKQILHPSAGPYDPHAQGIVCSKGFSRGKGSKSSSNKKSTAIWSNIHGIQ